MKKYLMMSAAVLSLMATSCTQEKDLYDPTLAEKAFGSSFEETIGEVNAEQDWKTVAEREASVTVSLGLDQEYTVAIYTQNPLFSRDASLLAMTSVREGQTANVKFDAAASQESFYVGVFDSKGRGVSETVRLDGNKLQTNVGAVSAKARVTRATEAEFPAYAMTAQQALGSLTVADMKNYYALTDNVIADETNDGKSLNNGKWGWDEDKQATVQLPVGTDSRHFRVPAGVEVTKLFALQGYKEGYWDQFEIDCAVIYVEGKLNIGENYTLNGVTIVVGDGGEVALSGTVNMTNASRLVVLGNGKVTGADNTVITVTNAGSFYNAGNIEFKGTLNCNGSQMYNCGTIKVDQLLNAAGTGVITNFGKIDIKRNGDASDAYNCRLINACYYHASEKAGFGQITMLKNSRIDVDGWAEFAQSWVTLDVALTDTDGSNLKNATVPNPNIMMDKSVINVGTAFCTNTVFQGPTGEGEFAIVKMGKVQLGNGTDISQRDNCYFDWDITEVYSKDPGKGVATSKIEMSNPEAINQYVKTHITKFTREATSAFTIPAGECTGKGYNTDPGESIIPGSDEDPLPVNYSVAFEDLGSTNDFDFNDIVLYVAHNTKTNKATVDLVAAGGTLQVNVKYNGTTIFTKEDGVMRNTYTKGDILATATVDMTSAADLEKFAIEVIKDPQTSRFIESAAATGKAPMALIIPNKWQWPTEFTHITDAYPGFTQWVKSTGDNGWYNTPVASKVVK